MSSQKEVVIVGAGVTGCSIAYHLAKRGVPSQVIDRDSIAARASGKSWAICPYSPCYLLFDEYPPDSHFHMPEGSVRPFLELFYLTYHRLPDIALEIREKGFADIGLHEFPWIWLALSEDDENFLKHTLSRLRSEGYYEQSWLDAADVKAIFPNINPQVRGGVAFPCKQFEPYRYVMGLAQVAEQLGASFRQGEVVGFLHKGSRITSVNLASGTRVNADVVVLAMGPWVSQGASWLGKEMSVMITRDQCLRAEVPERFPLYGLMAGDVTILPQANGEVIIGSDAVDVQPSLDDITVTEDFKAMVISAAIDLLPSLQEAKIVEHRGDFEAYGPAPKPVQPVLGRLPDWDNVYIAARIGLGQSMSLGVGQCMADLIIAEGRIPYRIKNMMEVLSPARL